MADPFLGEVKLVSFPFPPKGWALCNGQLLAISTNSALFSLLGTTYGGNGISTFALPDLRGRIPHHFGTSQLGDTMSLGEKSGVTSVTLLSSNLPAHNHQAFGSSAAGTLPAPSAGTTWAASASGDQQYSSAAPNTTMAPASLGNAGGNQPHGNMPPYLTLNYIIALQGVFPSRN